jgi:hypothetical protein
MFAHEDIPPEVPPPGVTGWYEANQLPVRSGVYETTLTDDGRFCAFRYFDGVNWYKGGGSPNDALRNFQFIGERIKDPLRWRGLTERAK